MAKSSVTKAAQRRKTRVRSQLRLNAAGRPRLSVHRTEKNTYAQLIDDTDHRTLASASTLESGLKSKLKSGGNVTAAQAIGKLIAERAKKAGVKEVVFDRGARLYHGRVKALADAARDGGLVF